MRYASWSVGFQLWAFIRPLQNNKKKKKSQSHTLSWSALLSQKAKLEKAWVDLARNLKSIIHFSIPGRESFLSLGGKVFHHCDRKFLFLGRKVFYPWAGKLIHSYGGICGLPFGRVLRQRTDTWCSGNVSASRCGGILQQGRTAWACIFQSPRPWWSRASGVGDDELPLCWCPYNSSHISNNESGCLTSAHHRRQVLKRANSFI